MAEQNLASNPFAALFPSVSQAQLFTTSTLSGSLKGPPDGTSVVPGVSTEAIQALEVNKFLENVFLITLDKEPDPNGDRPDQCVFLEELHQSLKDQDWLDLENIEQAFFERLMLDKPGDHEINTRGTSKKNARNDAGEDQILHYIYQCFVRLKQRTNGKLAPHLKETGQKVDNVIISNARTCLQHPEIFPDLDTAKQLHDIFFKEYGSMSGDCFQDFLDSVAMAISDQPDEGSVLDAFAGLFDLIKKCFINDVKLGTSAMLPYLEFLQFFTRQPSLAEAFIDYNKPSNVESGVSYEQTLIGAVLSISCIPKNDRGAGPSEFFDNPSRYSSQEHSIVENSIQQPLAILSEKVHLLLKNLLKVSPTVKHKTLEWIGQCLHANAGRAKIWSHHMPAIFQGIYSSDAFFMNLCSVLLHLCKPFSSPCSPKLLKIQPSYCVATASKEGSRQRNVHITGLHEQTTMVPGEENEHLPVEESYNFISECFFMTHFSLYVGFHVLNEKFTKLNQELHRAQNMYQDLQAQGSMDTEVGQRVKQHMEKGMTQFLCIKAAMLEPKLLENCIDFHTATASYLNHIATCDDPSVYGEERVPKPEHTSPTLSAIPEFLIDNIMDFMIFIRRYKDSMYEIAGQKLKHVMTMVLVFMGSRNRLHNPHVRAKMAEALEALMPPQSNRESSIIDNSIHRSHLLLKHKLISHLGRTLLHVFVSIEMTGQGVEFEQKFNYRRPMYAILEQIWAIPVHNEAIKCLAKEAEENIDATDPPLFLQFINLLINDAIFLLDEALSYMSQIREKEAERGTGNWPGLPEEQRQEAESSFRHLGMLARIHNLLGNDTINALQLLTKQIKSIFTHSVMVDRVAAMLNYFLLHLVGPKKKNLKVKDFDEYDFKPRETVSHICQIYLNLGDTEKFCLAVSGDGRSYSPDLFIQAEQVLIKIHTSPEMVMRFRELAGKVKSLAAQQKEEEDSLQDAPDEFLDPIMGTLMRDPVTLPSSSMTVDRSTIARHLLSDQTDPFNRSPLTMDKIITNMELRQKIDEWIKKRQQ